MKKLLSLILAVLLLVMGVVAFAEDNKQTIENYETHTADAFLNWKDATTEEVISVDVFWFDMEYDYYDAAAGTWNPETMTYNDAGEAHIEQVTPGEITIDNRSNVAISVTCSAAVVASIASKITAEVDLANEWADSHTTTVEAPHAETNESGESVMVPGNTGFAFRYNVVEALTYEEYEALDGRHFATVTLAIAVAE